MISFVWFKDFKTFSRLVWEETNIFFSPVLPTFRKKSCSKHFQNTSSCQPNLSMKSTKRIVNLCWTKIRRKSMQIYLAGKKKAKKQQKKCSGDKFLSLFQISKQKKKSNQYVVFCSFCHTNKQLFDHGFTMFL